MSSVPSSGRDKIVEFLRSELIGPRHGDEEVLSEAAFKRYTAGTLYPQNSDAALAIADDEEDVSGQPLASSKSGIEDQGDDPVALANQYLPSSMGLSFYIDGDPKIEIDAIAAWYEETDSAKDDGPGFVRRPIHDRILIQHEGSGKKEERFRKKVLDGRGILDVLWRDTSRGWLVTVSVINSAIKEGKTVEQHDCLHQVQLRCCPTSRGRIQAYHLESALSNDPEDDVLEILYRDQVTYAVGHGCSVDWETGGQDSASCVWTEHMPSYEVPPIAYALGSESDDVLSLYFLAQGNEHVDQLVDKLHDFLSTYRNWISAQQERNSDIPDRLSGSRDLLVAQMNAAAKRIEAGVDLIESDPDVREAFFLANRAMLNQHIHSESDAYAGAAKSVGDQVYEEPILEEYRVRKWYPFQLAFQLLTLPSVAFPDDPFRETVDLIWFPTGGGKTEAYLAITAFQIFYRRLVHGEAGYGTTALMRYTLRLLTTQQFQRAASLLCACEMIRRENPRLGEEEMSIGLWVGRSLTPNTYQEAFEVYESLLEEDEPGTPFQISRCPWCGTRLAPEYRAAREVYGFESTVESFLIRCPEHTCPFHKALPIKVVDQQLYDSPPTLLLATVDKFARMPWVGDAGVFFSGRHHRPPELIIQDELHLISGPLGTMVGLYETAIQQLTSREGESAKIIASTATIRRAGEQCKGLYARSVELFPPSGLRADDSFFARYDYERPGRMFVGFMGQGHTGATSMIRCAAALLQALVEVPLQEDETDAYWTLVAYHNSLRELGKTLTFARDDIPARIQVIATDQSKQRDLSGDRVAELTSAIGGDLTAMLDRLEARHGHPRAISFLACTNMLSVGVDIQRLGLMLVNGQPKSTSEYIQATSRIGRGVDGLVFTLLSASKPRDRSHFERFVAYHAALYKQVEPTSVTPFSPPARDRALHAVLVTLVRHLAGLQGESEAANFDREVEGISGILDKIVARVSLVDPEEAEATRLQLEQFVKAWEARAEQESNLKFSSSTPQVPSLLRNPGNHRSEGWDTLHSMRSVDKSSLIKIIRG